MIAAPGITVLTPAQTDETETLFGVRFLAIQKRPEDETRRVRRAARKRARLRNDGQKFGG